jgi:adenylate cyclase, class 2
MAFEVEQKFPLDDPQAFAARVRELGAAPGKESRQVDQYFNHPARDFAETDEALRIRSVGESNFVTYKGPKRDKRTKTRQEIELPIDSGKEASQQFGELLQALGFRSVAVVSKRRQTFDLDWHGRQFELALDEIDDLGRYAELETMADEPDVAAAQEALLTLAETLELTQIERRSYLEMVLQRQSKT